MRVVLRRRSLRNGLKVGGMLLGASLLLTLPFLLSKPTYAFSGGSGTQLDPYQISTPADLASLTGYQGSANSGKYFKLMNDIDLNVSPYNSGSGWTPIGVSSTTTAFYGKFDGNNHTISNLFTNRSSTYVGLFGLLYTGAVVQNLTITNATITGSAGRVGVLAGVIQGTTVTNVSTSGTVTAGGTYAGGLVGHSYISAISTSHSSANVTSTSSSVGGLVGYIEGRAL